MKDSVTNVLWLTNLVRENIRAKQLFTPSNSILVTLSGGQDSLCSLLFLYLLQNQLDLGSSKGRAKRLQSEALHTCDLHTQTKPTLTANSSITNLNFIPEWVYGTSFQQKAKVRPARIITHAELRGAKRSFAQQSEALQATVGHRLPEHSSGKPEGGNFPNFCKAKASKVSEALAKLRSADIPTEPLTATQLRSVALGCEVTYAVEVKGCLAKGRVTVASYKIAVSRRVMLLFARAQPKAKLGQSERIVGLWIVQPRQLKSVRIKRFTAVRGQTFSDINSKHKVACVKPSITCESKLLSSQALPGSRSEHSKACSAEERVSKLEHYSPLGALVLLPFFSQPLSEQASDQIEKPDTAIENPRLLGKSPLKKMKTSVNSYFYSATANQTLFDSAEPSSYFNPKGPGTELPNSFRLLLPELRCRAKLCNGLQSFALQRNCAAERNSATEIVHSKSDEALQAKMRATRLKKSGGFLGEFGVLWCNHFWQIESFYTMLHVAKINFCFSSIICFYLPLESVFSEQNAREWRHKSIQRISAFYQYDGCTQAHTKSDRVETILFNIVRGTGISGLQSLQWKKSFYSFSCQRFFPMLSFAHQSVGSLLLRKSELPLL